jgi:hypothetical protein
MKTRLVTLALALTLTAASSAFAVDEGNSVLKLSKVSQSYGTSVDLIPLTTGAGNLKGIHCNLGTVSQLLSLKITLDGGTTQAFIIRPYFIDGSGNEHTGFIPMNLRFETSIRVQTERLGSPVTSGTTTCVASWGLD